MYYDMISTLKVLAHPVYFIQCPNTIRPDTDNELVKIVYCCNVSFHVSQIHNICLLNATGYV